MKTLSGILMIVCTVLVAQGAQVRDDFDSGTPGAALAGTVQSGIGTWSTERLDSGASFIYGTNGFITAASGNKLGQVELHSSSIEDAVGLLEMSFDFSLKGNNSDTDGDAYLIFCSDVNAAWAANVSAASTIKVDFKTKGASEGKVKWNVVDADGTAVIANQWSTNAATATTTSGDDVVRVTLSYNTVTGLAVFEAYNDTQDNLIVSSELDLSAYSLSGLAEAVVGFRSGSVVDASDPWQVDNFELAAQSVEAGIFIADDFDWGSGVTGRESLVFSNSIDGVSVQDGGAVWDLQAGSATFSGAEGAGNGFLRLTRSASEYNGILIANCTATGMISGHVEGIHTVTDGTAAKDFRVGFQALEPDQLLMSAQTTDKLSLRVTKWGALDAAALIDGVVFSGEGDSGITFTSGDTLSFDFSVDMDGRTVSVTLAGAGTNNTATQVIEWTDDVIPDWDVFAVNATGGTIVDLQSVELSVPQPAQSGFCFQVLSQRKDVALGDRVMDGLICATGPEVKGAHDSQMIILDDCAYIVALLDDTLAGEAAMRTTIYCGLSIVDINSMEVLCTIPFAASEQEYANETLPVGACFVPRILQKDANTLRCYFASEQPGVRQSQTWYIDFDLSTRTFEDSIYRAQLKTAAGVFDMQPQYFYEDAFAQGLISRAPAVYGLYICNQFKEFDGTNYVALCNYPVGQNALAVLNDEMDTFEIVGHYNGDGTAKLTESAFNRMPDGTWAAICRQENGSKNFVFVESETGQTWSTGEYRDVVPNGVSAKPTFDWIKGQYWLGWQEDPGDDADVTRSIFNVEVSPDGINWERRYRFVTDKSFQYPMFCEYEGHVYVCVTQGDYSSSRKERIMFGRVE
jgi:hypothetical protein